MSGIVRLESSPQIQRGHIYKALELLDGVEKEIKNIYALEESNELAANLREQLINYLQKLK